MFVVVVLVLERITPQYNWQEDYISELSLKKYGWVQKINFVVSGLLVAALAFSLSQQANIFWVKVGWVVGAFCGLITAAAGILDTDVKQPIKTRSGRLHDWTWYLGSPGLAVSYLLIGFGYKNHPLIFLGSVLVVVFDLVWFFYSSRLGIKPGIGQRMVIFSSLAWAEFLAIWTLWLK